jgi:hypothetical protein
MPLRTERRRIGNWVDYGRLIRERFERAQAAVKNFNVANAYFFNATK